MNHLTLLWYTCSVLKQKLTFSLQNLSKSYITPGIQNTGERQLHSPRNATAPFAKFSRILISQIYKFKCREIRLTVSWYCNISHFIVFMIFILKLGIHMCQTRTHTVALYGLLQSLQQEKGYVMVFDPKKRKADGSAVSYKTDCNSGKTKGSNIREDKRLHVMGSREL